MKSLPLLLVLLIGTLCNARSELQYIRSLFQHWRIAHKRYYKGEYEETIRFNIFLKNYAFILKHNQENTDVVLGLNQFADFNNEEVARWYTGLLPKENTAQTISSPLEGDLPESWDWREKNAVTPVKNQFACGSSWAFPAVGALEALHVINGGQLENFSEQQLVDCCDKAFGCSGGWFTDAYEYTAKYGIERSADYPYVAKGQKCAYNASKAIKVNTGYVNVTPKSSDELKRALLETPVSVAVRADQSVFLFYKSGVITAGCGDDANHGVLAVGYDKTNGVESFIVKNTWSTTWGDQGYVRIGTDESQNNGNGVCGILKFPSRPTK